MPITATEILLMLLVFQLGAQVCAVPLEKVREVVPMARLAQLPGQPSLLEGFLNLRGTAVPVVRLYRLFDLPPHVPGLYTPLLVLRGEPLAILADAVLEIASPAPGDFLPVRENHCFNACAPAEVALGDRLVPLLSCERMLLEEERRCVAELQARAQRYLGELEAPAQ